MHEEIFRALEQGFTVLTASGHLARVLAREYHAAQAARGCSLWNRPDVLPLDAFLDRTWSAWLANQADENAPVLLSMAQEQMLWERIICESPAGASLLQIPETARQAIETWRLIVEYRIPVDARFDATDDWSAFAGWSREFRRRCKTNQWLERAKLADFLRSVVGPSTVYAAGFDDLTPQQSEFFDAFGGCRPIHPPDLAAGVQRRKLRDSAQEIRSAAAWAHRMLEQDPETRIGIVVAPDLLRSRAAVQRIFRQVLDPGADWDQGEKAFHLSAGPALAEYPVLRSALWMLEFAVHGMPLPRAGMLLRSPFLGGSEEESGKRAQLDAKLRSKGSWDFSAARLREEAGSCPQLQRLLRRVEKQLRNMVAARSPSAWSLALEDLLDAFGWPGDRSPGSVEFQTIARLRDLLRGLASLDLTAPAMSLAQAADWLRQQCATTRFQVEDEGAPVQVMGMLEAAGLTFDHLWILGLHDEALPAPANPNPFLPGSLQREYGLPHSSPQRELEFAGKVIGRLLASAPDVVLSYPATEGDRLLAPSPLVAGGVWLDEPQAPPAPAWPIFEEIADERGPAFARSDSTGGMSLFKDMAACPFRAFAKHRLAARPLEESDVGLSYRDRGSTVHTALELIWRELGSQARLRELSPRELEAVITSGADAAVQKLGPGIGRDLEKQRLERLLAEWFEIEKSRPEFAVAATEAEHVAMVGGLQIRIRADRVDALPDGREIILDYKTGLLKPRGWDGERPDEPQLPLYCITSEQRVAGAAFAVVRTGELRFRGLAENDVHLPELAKMTIDPAVPFERQLTQWRRVLERLAEDFRDGHARVDPKPDACDHCGLRALCRIREIENDRR